MELRKVFPVGTHPEIDELLEGAEEFYGDDLK